MNLKTTVFAVADLIFAIGYPTIVENRYRQFATPCPRKQGLVENREE